MPKFRIGGAGPDGRGLGRIAGITKRRFDRSGEIYETDNPCEIKALRQCPYVEEMDDPEQADNMLCSMQFKKSREELKHKKMKELIKMGSGLYRIGMTKAELIDKIITNGRNSAGEGHSYDRECDKQLLSDGGDMHWQRL